MSLPFLLAFLAYVLPTFPLGYFWHLGRFARAYEELDMYRPNVIIPMGLASMVVQGAIFAWIYPRLFDTAPAAYVQSTLGFFAMAGVLAWSFVVLPVAAKYRMTDTARFFRLETTFTLIQFAIAAPLIAWAWMGHRA